MPEVNYQEALGNRCISVTPEGDTQRAMFWDVKPGQAPAAVRAAGYKLTGLHDNILDPTSGVYYSYVWFKEK